MMLRRVRRAVALAITLAICVLRYWVRRFHGRMTLERRALWLQESARGVLKSIDIRYEIEGEPPTCGLVVANHLSYLDILAICAVTPAVFVSKADVRKWPLFGWFAGAISTVNEAEAISRAAVATARRTELSVSAACVCRRFNALAEGTRVSPVKRATQVRMAFSGS